MGPVATRYIVALDGYLYLINQVCMTTTRRFSRRGVRIEKDVRYQLMQHIIDSREGKVNTNSTHYRYFQNKKRMVESLSRFDPLEMLAKEASLAQIDSREQ